MQCGLAVDVAISIVASPENREIGTIDEGDVRKPRKRRIATSDCEGGTHGRGRSRDRFLGSREVGVAVHIDKTDA